MNARGMVWAQFRGGFLKGRCKVNLKNPSCQKPIRTEKRNLVWNHPQVE